MADQENDLFLLTDEGNIDDMYLTFGIKGETYAVNIAHVTEIVSMQKISEVPDVPNFIKGVVNLRGKVIPVMDVRLRFGLPWQPYTDRTTIIVLELEGVPTGLVVDEVFEVLELPENQVDPPPRWQAGRSGQGIIHGLGKKDTQVCIILNLNRLLHAQEINMEQIQEIISDAKSVAVDQATAA